MELAKQSHEDADQLEEENTAARLAELERKYAHDTETANKKIAELEAQLAQKESESKEMHEKLQSQKTLLDNLSSLLNNNNK